MSWEWIALALVVAATVGGLIGYALGHEAAICRNLEEELKRVRDDIRRIKGRPAE